MDLLFKDNFLKNLYAEHLATITGIKFTRREIDIISFLTSGRSAKKIGAFFSLSPKTIENYTCKIMLKLGCNSKEGIIDFIEQSGQFLWVKKYYTLLLRENIFEKALQAVASLKGKDNIVCTLMCWQDAPSHLTFMEQLSKYLKLGGLEISFEIRKITSSLHKMKIENLSQNEFIIHEVPRFLFDDYQTELKAQGKNEILFQDQIFVNNHKIFLCLESEKNEENQCHYDFVFEILKIILPQLDFKNIIVEFKNADLYRRQESLQDYHLTNFLLNNENENPRISLKKINKSAALYTLLGMGLLFDSFFIINQKGLMEFFGKENLVLVHDNLTLPSYTSLLERPELLQKIADSFNAQPVGIRTLALVGIGGAGKTTLTRQYAHAQDASLMWELNAETRESLYISFERLAQTLAKTEVDKKNLKGIQEIKNYSEKREKTVAFVKEKMKFYSKWILIFDNVDEFSALYGWFPQDAKICGQGDVIITTRNDNIQNNKYINQIIKIKELTSDEKLEFFTKIMTQGNKYLGESIPVEETKSFLNKIASFPLDVSIAAYYIKATNISYNKYLEYLYNTTNDFEEIQKNILNESGDYIKTRHSIISLSLQKLINTHKDFQDLLLYISLIDSQNIPRYLLVTFKDELIIDNFIHSLKKYSLITEKSDHLFEENFSIHRKLQGIMLDYLKKGLALEKENPSIQAISHNLATYISDLIEKGELLKAQNMITHCQAFLKHQDLLTDTNRGAIESELGGIYADLANYERSKELLEKGLTKLETDELQNRSNIARGFSYLGSVYEVQGYYEKAKGFLQKSLLFYKNYFPQEHHKIARILLHLGNAYRDTGDYNKAKELLEESLLLYKNYFQHDLISMAEIHKYLGNIYRLLGDNKKAIFFLNQGLLLYNQSTVKNPLVFASILSHLGYAYEKAENHGRAKDLLEESIETYTQYLPENHIMIAWPLYVLGDIYRELKHYAKARRFLMRSLKIYRKNLPNNDFSIGGVLLSLGDVYRDCGDYEKAKNLMEQSLVLYKKHSNNHVKVARILAHLGDVYGKLEDYTKAQELLNQSLFIYKDLLPINHPEVVWTSKCLKNYSR